MRMYLKNKNIKKKNKFIIKFNSKNLFVFLISFSMFAIVLGIMFFCFLNNSDKLSSINNLLNSLTISDNYNYVKSLRESLLENSFTIFFIWLLGLSVVGVFIIIFIYFCYLFAIGFNISGLFYKFGVKGIGTSFCYLFPSKIVYLIILFLLVFFSIKISYKFIKLCFLNKDINIKQEIRRYFKILVFSFIGVLVVSLLKVFIDPFFINISGI